MMNRSYSKMRAMRSRSRSVEDLDLVVDSDLLGFSSAADDNNKPTSKNPRTAEAAGSERSNINPSLCKDHQPASDKLQQHKEEVLHSASSSSSKRFGMFEKQQQRSIGAQCSAAIKKRAFSFTRSSSVSSESYYSRIHDQSEMTLASSCHIDDDEDGAPAAAGSPSSTLKIKKKNNKGGNKIFKACKRIFGL